VLVCTAWGCSGHQNQPGQQWHRAAVPHYTSAIHQTRAEQSSRCRYISIYTTPHDPHPVQHTTHTLQPSQACALNGAFDQYEATGSLKPYQQQQNSMDCITVMSAHRIAIQPVHNPQFSQSLLQAVACTFPSQSAHEVVAGRHTQYQGIPQAHHHTCLPVLNQQPASANPVLILLRSEPPA
jgi:aspartate aminotransferase-like enzyme